MFHHTAQLIPNYASKSGELVKEETLGLDNWLSRVLISDSTAAHWCCLGEAVRRWFISNILLILYGKISHIKSQSFMTASSPNPCSFCWWGNSASWWQSNDSKYRGSILHHIQLFPFSLPLLDKILPTGYWTSGESFVEDPRIELI